MAEYMFLQVKAGILKEVSSASYIALSADETSTLDNGSWISIHAYVVKDWVRVPYLISLEQVVDGAAAINLTAVLIKALKSGGGLDDSAICSKLLSFGADGVSTFQGARNGVTVQL
ncbi:hypothetical protein M758_UG159300 [Ceratodon purpureus]|nr:hypothetical protein M758_UG159300 [Ceratodon purpureus]